MSVPKPDPRFFPGTGVVAPTPCRRCGCGDLVPTEVLRAGERGRNLGWLIIVAWAGVAGFFAISTLSEVVAECGYKGNGPEKSLGFVIVLALLGRFFVIFLPSIAIPAAAHFFLIRKTTQQRCNACGW